MNHQLFKFAGLNSAILAVLMIVIAPFELSAQPLPVPDGGLTKEQVQECTAADAVDPAALAPVNDFWQQAWGRELSAGAEGMVLQETGASGVWDILVGSKTEDRYSARGAFVEEARYPVNIASGSLDHAYKLATKATGIQRYVIAGTVTGSTGSAIAVTAMVTHLTNDSGSIGRLFSLLQVATDSSRAVTFAEDAASRLDISGGNASDSFTSAEPGIEASWLDTRGGNDSFTSAQPGIEKSVGVQCLIECKNTRDLRYLGCELIVTGCIAAAAAVAVGCVATCTAGSGGLGLPICLAACDLAFVAASAVCVGAGLICRSLADTAFQTCKQGCSPCAINCGGGDPTS